MSSKDQNSFQYGNPMVSHIRFAIGFSYMSFISCIYIVLAVLCLPSRVLRIKLGNIYGTVVGPVVIWIVGSRANIQNRKIITANKPAIYLSNHTTGLDPLIAIWLCPMGGCGVAKKEIARVPFFGWAYRLSGHLLIDRSNQERAIASMKAIAELVRKHNLSIWIWPEGTRSKDGRLLPLKKGFAHLAIQTGFPIVPIVVHNGHHRWHSHHIKLSSGPLDIEVLPPIDTSKWTIDNISSHITEVHNIYNAALAPEQRLLNTQ